MLSHTYSSATAPIDFSFLQSYDGLSRSGTSVDRTIQLNHIAECPTPVQPDAVRRSKRAMSVSADRAGNREHMAVKRVCTAVISHLVFTAVLGLMTAVVAYLVGFVSQSSAYMFVLGSWSAHFVAGYNVLHQNAMFVPSRR